jgi:putative protein-disulfide isomerase
MQSTLYYVHDPMCSWCFGFEPVRAQLFTGLENRIRIKRMLGGLAPDSDAPMPEAMRMGLQQTWRQIEQVIPGTEFNFDFWKYCAPRRSTYPANRAVIAARLQGEENDLRMTARIQQAYYREARNPSNNETLVELAADIGLDVERFSEDLVSDAIERSLLQEIQDSRVMGIMSFPSLAVGNAGGLTHIGLNYTDAGEMLYQVEASMG